MKKGEFGIDEISKILVVLAVLLFILIMVWLLRDKLLNLFDNFNKILRFR